MQRHDSSADRVIAKLINRSAHSSAELASNLEFNVKISQTVQHSVNSWLGRQVQPAAWYGSEITQNSQQPLASLQCCHVVAVLLDLLESSVTSHPAAGTQLYSRS